MLLPDNPQTQVWPIDLPGLPFPGLCWTLWLTKALPSPSPLWGTCRSLVAMQDPTAAPVNATWALASCMCSNHRLATNSWSMWLRSDTNVCYEPSVLTVHVNFSALK